MGEIAEILGVGKTIEFGRRCWRVKPLTFNDLCELEERFGDVEQIDLSKLTNQRFALWLILRDSEPERGQYTEREIGELLTLAEPKQIAEFVSQVFELSGLTQPINRANAAKNARPPKAVAAA